MSTPSSHPGGGPDHRFWRRWGSGALAPVVAILVVVVGLAAASPSFAGGGPDGVGDGTDWRDLAAAEARLDSLESFAEQGRAEIRAIEAEIEALGASRETLSEQDAEYVARLSDAQTRARRLAVQAYISGGASREVEYMLDAETAADLTWRNHMLGTHAGTIMEASESFVELRSAADRTQIQIAAELDRLAARIDQIAVDIAHAEAQVPEAEHVVEIAEIHALAEEALARSGRPDPSPEEWSRLRFCESTWNYEIASGNGFYGAYQFDYQTWFTVGGEGLASEAPPEEQDARARLLYARRGSQPWPVCGHFLPDAAET